MTDTARPLPRIVYIDDDGDQLLLVKQLLSGRYNLKTAGSGREGFVVVNDHKPDIILLDINMPEMNGYEVCSRFQAVESTAFIPIIFLSALGEEDDKARAFAVGAADFLVKPVNRKKLVAKIETHLKTNSAWEKLQADSHLWYDRVQSSDFIGFKEYVAAQLNFDARKKYLFSRATSDEIYATSKTMGVGENVLSRFMSQYLNLPYITDIVPESIWMGILPTAFCKTNHVLPIYDVSENNGFILSNPFNLDLIQMLLRFSKLDESTVIQLTEPGKLDVFFADTSARPLPAPGNDTATKIPATSMGLLEEKGEDHPIIEITKTILTSAVVERASDIHFEPKETETEVRFRVDGDLRHVFKLKKSTGDMVISRLKVRGGVDIAEKRKPQDGGFVTTLNDRVFNFRLSTTSTPNGESLVMRLLEPYVAAKKLEDLGMSSKQNRRMVAAAGRSSGMILIVGSTGSGKTTTIYSLLHAIDYKKRSIMSVEDPVEYRIPFVNQQQVNNKAGVTFEALLKTSVRQDPDVLFMGEVRDGFSAKMAIDFASTGHLTITTLHTSNATSAVFRLQRLGIDPGTMADTIIAVVAQKLLKKLCPHCKEAVPISPEEVDMLSPFTDDIPSMVAHPVGCPECRNSGYLGREGIYEVLEFDPKISEMVRSGASIADIRSFARRRGDFLISTHAVSKVRELVFAPQDVFESALAEENIGQENRSPVEASAGPAETEADAAGQAGADGPTPAEILLVDDDADTRKLLARFLGTEGHHVTVCEDGIDALLNLGKTNFDLILSDVNMPNLDGFKLLEMVRQKGIHSPVVFLTSRTDTEDEVKGLSLGATDYIRKPIKKEILQVRVAKILEGNR